MGKEGVLLSPVQDNYMNESGIGPIWDALLDVSGNVSETSLEDVLTTPTSSVLKTVHDVLVVSILVTIMFAMGCHTTWNEIWQHLRRPIGVGIGMLSQFLLLPLAAFALMQALQLDKLHSAGMLVLSCSPGGTVSNVFAYFVDGDVSLSITMTTCSSVAALGFMPLNMWLYGQAVQTDSVVIPYEKMVISLCAITAPVPLGMLVKWKLPKIAPYVTKVGSLAGFCIIITAQTMEVFIFPSLFHNVPWKLWIAVCTLPTLGIILGYGLAWACRRTPPIRKTVGIESGIQNVGTALTIIALSFPFQIQQHVILFPFLYSFSMIGTCILGVFTYRTALRACKRLDSYQVEKEKPEVVEKNLAIIEIKTPQKY